MVFAREVREKTVSCAAFDMENLYEPMKGVFSYFVSGTSAGVCGYLNMDMAWAKRSRAFSAGSMVWRIEVQRI